MKEENLRQILATAMAGIWFHPEPDGDDLLELLDDLEVSTEKMQKTLDDFYTNKAASLEPDPNGPSPP